jgi:hypothetical protein
VVGGRWSVVGGQWSVVGGQLGWWSGVWCLVLFLSRAVRRAPLLALWGINWELAPSSDWRKAIGALRLCEWVMGGGG